jgi:hypothetical protein
MRGAALAALLLAPALMPSLAAQTRWQYEQPAGTPRTIPFANRLLTESSGVAVSRAQPGVLWTLNDSGNDPLLFATDTLGRDRGTFRVTGARNEDWEALRLARCGARMCIYIGDIGDNAERRHDVVIYRVPEPEVAHAGARSRATPSPRPTARATALRVRYSDGPHDAESLIVTPGGDLLLLTKSGRAIRLYRVPASAWGAGRTVIADSLGVVPIVPEAASLRLVTDAALAPDGRRVAVRTYREIFFLRLRGSHLEADNPPRACDTFGIQLQGEGVDWLDPHNLVLTSETAFIQRGSVAVISCPAIQ